MGYILFYKIGVQSMKDLLQQYIITEKKLRMAGSHCY